MATRIVIRVPTPQPTFPSTYVADIIRELNLARQNPREYARIIASPPYTEVFTRDEINETVSYLMTVTPCTTTLREDATLSQVAQAWAEMQGVTGQVGHGDFVARVAARGTYRALAENIDYGQYRRNDIVSARDTVVDWIVDRGVPSKGHRHNIFNCVYTQIGVGFAPHNSAYRISTDTVLANGFVAFS